MTCPMKMLILPDGDSFPDGNLTEGESIALSEISPDSDDTEDRFTFFF